MSNAYEWAEKALGITAIWEKSQIEQDVLDDLASKCDNATDEKRTLADKIRDREANLLIEERGKHADQSQAWMDRHMVLAKHTDPDLVLLRAEHQAASSILSGLEYDMEVQKSKLRLIEKRMQQQAGFLNFLAAAKQAETAEKTLQTQQTTKTQSEIQSDSEPTGNAAG